MEIYKGLSGLEMTVRNKALIGNASLIVSLVMLYDRGTDFSTILISGVLLFDLESQETAVTFASPRLCGENWENWGREPGTEETVPSRAIHRRADLCFYHEPPAVSRVELD
jgi:hypothetical protein